MRVVLFNTVKPRAMPPADNYGQQSFRMLNELQAGSGDRSVKLTREGLFVGGNTFADAPFSVDMSGNMKAISTSVGGTARVETINGTTYYYDEMDRLVGIAGTIPEGL